MITFSTVRVQQAEISPDKGSHVGAEFQGKVVVVTGASRGIGRAIAAAFAREGAQTVLASRSATDLAAAASDIAAHGSVAPLVVAGDLRERDACEALFETVRSRFGRCHVLVNNAGATQGGNFLTLPDELWGDGFALKFFACVRLCRLFWPLLKEARGHVVNIGGVRARMPHAQFLIGGAVNAAMANFSKGLSELGKRDGVNVNVIHPGLTETDRMDASFRRTAAASGRTPEEVRAQALADNALDRFGKSEEIADMALFLCSGRARYIQGSAIAVDGGFTRGFH